jgi:predicted metal-dependent hydrolase
MTSGRAATGRSAATQGPTAIETAAVATLPRGPLAYVLRRSPRSRRLRVMIDPRRGVIVSLPPAERRGWRHAERAVEAFLAEREAWIRRHLERAARARALVASAGELGDGAALRFRGDVHRIRVLPMDGAIGRSVVSREGGDAGDELVLRLASRDRRVPERVLREWLVERARVAIDREIGRHASALGVNAAAVALRDPKTRWGSASKEGRLSFSWRLVLAPPEALETVVVHELAHLRIFGHGPRFWDLVATRRPDHRVWRRWLREHSLELHAALADGG